MPQSSPYFCYRIFFMLKCWCPESRQRTLAPPKYGCCYTIAKFSMMVGPAIIVHVVQSVSAMNLFPHTSNIYLLIDATPFKAASLRLYRASPVILHHSELCMKWIVFNMASSSSNFTWIVVTTLNSLPVYTILSPRNARSCPLLNLVGRDNVEWE
jgi:hypothetical protein